MIPFVLVSGLVLLLAGAVMADGAIAVRDEVTRGNVACYEIRTPAATYYFCRKGAGLAGLVDPEGRDWISFDRNRDGAAGEYRGIPNAVHDQGGVSAFHPLNRGTTESTVRMVRRDPDRVTIEAECRGWKATWNFHPTHATFSMDRIPPDGRYWFLYEGTPYGRTEPARSWFYRSDGSKTPASDSFTGDLPDPEWVAFGHDAAPRVLLLMNHAGGRHVSRFWWMNPMTVFGFGRGGKTSEKHFREPRRFTIAFVESPAFDAVKAAAEQFSAGARSTAL